MQVITKNGTQITKLDLKAGQQVSGLGTLIGQFYRLPDGTTVYVPSGSGTTQTQLLEHERARRRGHAHAPRCGDHPDAQLPAHRRPGHGHARRGDHASGSTGQ